MHIGAPRLFIVTPLPPPPVLLTARKPDGRLLGNGRPERDVVQQHHEKNEVSQTLRIYIGLQISKI
jgi:hypothetical protein